ncbi:hypothetical protein ACEYXF_10020 [Streptomyces asiaticus]|uniref:AMP-binding enzyme n=1 Tax=Streptomyces asiaticus TaxID=114695 RepID=UPI0039BE678C
MRRTVRTERRRWRAARARLITSQGSYRIGDLGMARIEDGYRCYSVEGRIKDVINRGGERVGGDELEALLAGRPAIAAVAVVAMPDAGLGEKACAYVVPQPGSSVDLAGIQHYFVHRGVAKFKWPERVESVGALPRTAVGKIDKNAMRVDIATRLATPAAILASESPPSVTLCAPLVAVRPGFGAAVDARGHSSCGECRPPMEHRWTGWT